MSAPAPAPAPRAESRWSRLDTWLLLAIAVAWAALVRAGQGPFLALPYDSLRDTASVYNFLAGRFDDPAFRGATWWYAPGYPLLMAAACRATGAGVLAVCGSAAYWLSVLLPIGLYVAVRRDWGRAAALLALPIAGLGSLWWLTHYRAAMPSVLGVAPVLFGWACWSLALERGIGWAFATGALLAATAWLHPLCAAAFALALALHAAGLVLARGHRAPPDRIAVVGPRLAAALATGALAAAPLAFHLLGLARVNRAPLDWFAPELHDPGYALQLHAPLVPVLGLFGAFVAWRSAPRRAGIVAWLAAGTLGALAGYARHDLGWPMPSLLPHEFQWHAQMAMGACAAIGTLEVARRAATRPPWRRAAIALLLIAAVGPAFRRLELQGRAATVLDRRWTGSLELAAWIRANTSLDDCLIAPPEASLFANGLTGRKVVALPAGHSNPSVDLAPRLADLEVMLGAPPESTFARVAARYAPCWLLAFPPPGQAALARAEFARWQSLEAANLRDSTAQVYRVTIAPAPRRAGGRPGS